MQADKPQNIGPSLPPVVDTYVNKNRKQGVGGWEEET